MSDPTVFLLSPAHCGGKRAALLMRDGAGFELAVRLREAGGAPLGEVFSFVSGLYFRGKMAYAEAFARPPEGVPGALVITSGRGLVSPTTRVGVRDLVEFASIPVDLLEPRYRDPLVADIERLGESVPETSRIVLLGSIATSKYVEVLVERFGPRLFVPEPFIGMGDMQRGALMLSAAREGRELPYLSAVGAVRRRAERRGRS